MIFLENETFGLEPVPQSTTNEHLLYLLKDVQSEPVTCGVVSEDAPLPTHEPFEPGQSLTSLLRVGILTVCTFQCDQTLKKRRCSDVIFFYCLLFQQRKRNLPQTRYVELALVVDQLRVCVYIFLNV